LPILKHAKLLHALVVEKAVDGQLHSGWNAFRRQIQRQFQRAVLVAGATGNVTEGERVRCGGEQLDSAVCEAEGEEGARNMTCHDHPAKMT
jgi:hypothetical protein